MSEVAFPLLGAALVITLVLPATALLARLCLAALGPATPIAGLRRQGLRHGVIVAASVLPLAWFASAAAHQAESGRSVLACLLDHGDDAACVEPRMFSLALLAAITLLALPSITRALLGAASVRAARRQPSNARITALVEGASLSNLRGRVYVVAGLEHAIATRGIVRPVVLVRSEWFASLDDAAATAALAHEAEHVRARDPLRYLLLWFSAAVNPLGGILLRGEAGRWVAAREVECDRLAVARGADAAALAHALVAAARPAARSTAVAALVQPELRALELRVELLLAYAEHPPVQCDDRGAPTLRFALGILALVIALPHSGETAALDVLHVGTERAVASFFP